MPGIADYIVSYIPPPVHDFVDSANRVLFASTQNSLSESIAADLYDIAIGLVPILGDFVSNAPRVASATAQKDRVAQILHGTDFAIDLIPGVGDIIDAILPANTILRIRDTQKCRQKGGDTYSCLVQPDSFEARISSSFANNPLKSMTESLGERIPAITPIDAVFERIA